MILRVGEPVTDQPSVLDCPEVMLAGVAAKLVILGALPTVTVAVAVTDPNVLVAVRLYVVVVDGDTLREVPVTVPMPWSMLKVGEPVTAHARTLDCAVAMFAGVAAKLVIVGALPTVTVAVAVTDPNEFVAVSL